MPLVVLDSNGAGGFIEGLALFRSKLGSHMGSLPRGRTAGHRFEALPPQACRFAYGNCSIIIRLPKSAAEFQTSSSASMYSRYDSVNSRWASR